MLWPKGDSDSFYSEGFVHYGIGESNRMITCPKTFNSKNKCPICEHVEELQQSKSKADKDLANSIRAKRAIYVNVINRDDDDESPKVLRIGVTILKGILELICDADYGDITDPETGRDITITKNGKGLNTTYTVMPKPKDSLVSEEQTPEEIEEEMTDLDSLFVEKSYDEIYSILNDEDSDDEDEDYDEEEDAADYDSMSLSELKAECEERGIELPVKANRLKLVTLLTQDDEDSEDYDDDDDEADDVQSAISAALAKRGKSRRK